MSDISTAPMFSMSARLTTDSGDGESAVVRRMKDPVTTISSMTPSSENAGDDPMLRHTDKPAAANGRQRILRNDIELSPL
jgi:hypothetical protein